MSDFKSPAGSFAKIESGQTGGQPRAKGEKPSTGFDNSTHGQQAAKGPGQGMPANGKRIR